MPKFISYHAHAPEMPPEVVQGAIAAIKAGKPDEFGVTPINAFFSPATGEAYYLDRRPQRGRGVQVSRGQGYAIGQERRKRGPELRAG